MIKASAGIEPTAQQLQCWMLPLHQRAFGLCLLHLAEDGFEPSTSRLWIWRANPCATLLEPWTTAIATGIMSPMHLRGIEPRSFGWKPNILTIELQMLTVGSRIQLRGIEPRTHGWQPSILPLDHSCFQLLHHDRTSPNLESNQDKCFTRALHYHCAIRANMNKWSKLWCYSFHLESNQGQKSYNLLCCHYTMKGSNRKTWVEQMNDQG